MDTAAQALEPVEPTGSSDTGDPPSIFPLSNPGRALLAMLSVSAAIIHLVMVPAHAGEWLPEGLAFAASGWFQIGFAIAVVTKPSKRWLQVGVLANLVFIGAWTLTRTYGMPFGPESGSREAATFVDLTCVGIEAALVLACLVFAAKPRLGEDLDAGALVMASVVPVGVIVLTTAVLASPDARNHTHAEGADHGHGEVTAAGAPMDHAAAPMDHAADHAAGSHDAPAVLAADRCDWDFNTIAYWSQNPPLATDDTHIHKHSDAEGAAPAAPTADGKPAVGNKAGLQPWKAMTDKTQCATFKADLATMESFAKKYPTAQDAMDAGCARVTIYVPGIAAHYACFKNWDSKLDVNNPEMLLYGGSQPWAPMVGLSYYSMAKTVPGNDWQFGLMPFHVHEGLCVKGTLVIGGDGSDQASCEARGGKVMGQTGFMGHYWLPNCNSPDGVFSADNPRLDMGVANYNDDPKFDPAKGGDPTVLQANPCAGSKLTDQSSFGEPPAGATQDAAGAPTTH